MYQVIIVRNENKEKNYYYSYTESEDTTLGNISAEDLPPYQDINKARACYWDGEKWVYDQDKYSELVAESEAEKAAAEQARKEAASIPTNEELMYAVLDIASRLDAVAQSVSDLQNKVGSIQKEEV